MRKLQQFSVALVMVLMLSTGAFAGIIDTPPGAQQAPAPSITVAAIVLSLIQSLP
jgi:hypothetical protein